MADTDEGRMVVDLVMEGFPPTNSSMQRFLRPKQPFTESLTQITTINDQCLTGGKRCLVGSKPGDGISNL